MTLSEAIKTVNNYPCGIHCAGECEKCKLRNAVMTINEALKELEWYREQDLIKRNDIPIYCHLECERIHCESCGKTFSYCSEIMQIPKAEPPKEQSNDNR